MKHLSLLSNFKYKEYWRKAALDEYFGDVLLDLIKEKKPYHFLEVGVFCGVTARNVCELLNIIHNGKFSYTGLDLFEKKLLTNEYNEIEPEYIKNQKFSNPLKNFYYNFLLKENLNSIKSIEKFLIKFRHNIKLIQGDSNITLKQIDLSLVDFAFIDGGHSYKTALNDLEVLFNSMKNKRSTILCDDYSDVSYITEVKLAVDEFAKKNNLLFKKIKNKFAIFEL